MRKLTRLGLPSGSLAPHSLLRKLPLPIELQAAEDIAHKTGKQKMSAVWTMFGSWLALALYATWSGGFVDFWHAVKPLITFSASIDQFHMGDTTRMAPTIAAMVVVDLVLVIPIGIVVSKVVRLNKDDHGGSKMFDTRQSRKHLYLMILITLFLEELYARWLNIGVPAALGWLSIAAVFYLMFVIGNFTWSYVHLANIKNKNIQLKPYQKIVFVMPQFFGGILITAVYLPYGLFGAFIAHVVYDMVLFVSSRVDVFNLGEKVLCAFYALVAGVSGYMFYGPGDKSLSDMRHWFVTDATPGAFALPGWEFTDYLSATFMVYAGIRLLMEVLLFDHESHGNFRSIFRHLGWHIGAFLLACKLLVPFIFGWGTTLPLVGIIASLALLTPLFVHSGSGSGVGRSFWDALLCKSLVIAVLLSLNGNEALYLIGAVLAFELITMIISYFDIDEPVELCHCDCLCATCNPELAKKKQKKSGKTGNDDDSPDSSATGDHANPGSTHPTATVVIH